MTQACNGFRIGQGSHDACGKYIDFRRSLGGCEEKLCACKRCAGLTDSAQFDQSPLGTHFAYDTRFPRYILAISLSTQVTGRNQEHTTEMRLQLRIDGNKLDNDSLVLASAERSTLNIQLLVSEWVRPPSQDRGLRL